VRAAGLSVALGALIAAAPAAGQGTLAQACAQFGEGQYRTLDPTVERILPSPFPAPALEKIESKAGSQAIAAALTLRGRLVFRNRPALDTQFVCLLDTADRPLFFYALPVLAQRLAPTPIGRGSAAPPGPTLALPRQPEGAAAGLRAPLPPGAIRLRGLVREAAGAGRLMFEPCGGAPLALEDRTPGQELSRAYRDLTAGQESRPMFVEMYGRRETGPGAGVSAHELRRAAVETAGCRERFDQREWVVVGNEPPWRLDITGNDLLLSLGGNPFGRAGHGGLQREGTVLVYSSAEAPELKVTIGEQRCIDSLSGSFYAYLVELRSEGHAYVGCAAHNPAMPAP
jgi:uncharacterized membrane protein